MVDMKGREGRMLGELYKGREKGDVRGKKGGDVKGRKGRI